MKTFWFACLVCLLVPTSLLAQAAKPIISPWGVSSSAGSYGKVADWFPKVAAAGVTSVRGFYEWPTIERTPGQFNWDNADKLVTLAAENKLEINGIFMGKMPGSKAKSHEFPMQNLPEWANFVEQATARYQGKIRHWEVWNEGNAGFNDGHHTTADYAKLAAVTYNAAKKADPNAQVGLSVASFDPAYLNQAMIELKNAGSPNKFDTLSIHPYELADCLADKNGEVPYLWMTAYLRQALQANAPERLSAPIWISEIGRRVDGKKLTPEIAARDLTKLYVMALAQGIGRIQWFEGQDAPNEEGGFGLIDRAGKPRPGLATMKLLPEHLGPDPKYVGWLQLGLDTKNLAAGKNAALVGSGYGFLFQGASDTVLVAWMPLEAEATLKIATSAGTMINTVTGETTKLEQNASITLTSTPVLITKVGWDSLTYATANRDKPFPWGGNYAGRKQVSLDYINLTSYQHGIGQRGNLKSSRFTFPDGTGGLYLQANEGASFYCHPSFANLLQREYWIRVTVRRIGTGNVGMNLQYEIADSQGRGAYKNRGIWFGLSKDEGWQTQTWHVTDACFAKMWGFDFGFRPEQSQPFVIGKVEVSTEKFAD